MFDWTINLGHIITIVVTAAMIGTFVLVTRERVDGLILRMKAMENEMQQLVEVLIAQGRQEEKMISVDSRMLAQGQRIDDLTRQINRLFEPKNQDV